MNFKEDSFYLSISNSIENENYVLKTLCEKTTLFESKMDLIYPVSDRSEHLIRLLDNRVQLPLDEMYDVNQLSEEDLSEESLEQLFLDTDKETWEEYRKNHPVETSRQFLSTAHFADCINVFSSVRKGERPTIREPILTFFSAREKEYLEKQEVKVNKANLNAIKGKDVKGSFATSFLKSYIGGSEAVEIDPDEIRNQLHDMGLKDTHTGFAIGNIPSDIGIIEYDGINKNIELRHVSFWERRECYDDCELAAVFSFYDMYM
ncbi:MULTISPECIES: hypothetical protein [Enterococcus]|uniref:RES domain-containing protein n=1 Tax=Enterococcus asini TaxID=57732 RepID=A0AAW8U3R5_9ENTE|nr:hypothetical protein [Enterococcus asini]MDT2810623.1 hypothetical protein [Enterococcus asini]